VRFQTENGYLEINLDADRRAEFRVALEDVAQLSANDLIL